MSPYFQCMPVDKTTIVTQLHIHPDLVANPEAYLLNHDLPFRTMKPTRGKLKGRPTWNLTLDVLTYKGIKVKLVKFADDPLANVTIEFNPGVCLFGHNGWILQLTEFLNALAILATTLTPLLRDPDDWVDLVPGVRPNGRAYWSYLEVPFQCLDPYGELLARLRHLRHPSITKPSRHWPDTIKVGPRRGALQLSIYRKAIEMVARRKLDKSRAADYSDNLDEPRTEVLSNRPRIRRSIPQYPSHVSLHFRTPLGWSVPSQRPSGLSVLHLRARDASVRP